MHYASKCNPFYIKTRTILPYNASHFAHKHIKVQPFPFRRLHFSFLTSCSLCQLFLYFKLFKTCFFQMFFNKYYTEIHHSSPMNHGHIIL